MKIDFNLVFKGQNLLTNITFEDFFFFLGNGTGYAELLSYCTCDEETNTPFALCDKRSGICDGKRKKKLKGKGYVLFLTYLT